MPVVISCTQALGRATLPVAQGDHGGPLEGDRDPFAGRPRSRRGRRSGEPSPRRRSSEAGLPPARAATEVVRAITGRGRGAHRRLPRRAAAHLMGALWVVGEPAPDGGLARISAEAATLARELGATSGRDVVGIVVAADPVARRGGPRRLRAARLDGSRCRRRRPCLVGRRRGHGSPSSSSARRPDAICRGPGPDGRDLAGTLSALTGLGVLANATGVDLDRRRDPRSR